MQKNELCLLRGLRWSPLPIQSYNQHAPIGPYLSSFNLHRGTWNLFWITAAGLEDQGLSERQVCNLHRSARATAVQPLGEKEVAEWTHTLMPAAFADLLEAHPKEAKALRLATFIGEHWIWLIRDRAQLFHSGRVSDFGLPVVPQTQKETNALESTTIVDLSQFRVRRGR